MSFKLKFVRQEERKTLKVVYDRTKAVKRTFAPQGCIGMLLNELANKAAHFVEVDLDDPFFRELHVDVATPVDFARIGLFAADVAIDYGDPADPQYHRHQEFHLTAVNPGPQRFSTFLNAARDIDFEVGIQYDFEADSGGPASSSATRSRPGSRQIAPSRSTPPTSWASWNWPCSPTGW